MSFSTFSPFGVQSFVVGSFSTLCHSTFSHLTFSHSMLGLSTFGHSVFGHATFSLSTFSRWICWDDALSLYVINHTVWSIVCSVYKITFSFLMVNSMSVDDIFLDLATSHLYMTEWMYTIHIVGISAKFMFVQRTM